MAELDIVSPECTGREGIGSRPSAALQALRINLASGQGAETRRNGGAEVLCGPRPKVIPDHTASGPEESEGALRTRPALNLSAPPLLLRASA